MRVLGFVSGHGFSRATTDPTLPWASAPDVQRLKPWSWVAPDGTTGSRAL